jgi:aryl-alcohol dehydrogenase-like predicted oxidoreductase
MPPEIALGTVQIGMAYGFASKHGRPNELETACILQTAMDGGITRWDTARIYGDAEERIGTFLRGRQRPQIITKLSPIAPEVTTEAGVIAAIDTSLAASQRALRLDQIDAVMFHQSADRLKPGAMSRLSQHVAEGRIGALGASVYHPADAIACMDDPRMTHIQIPFNILDTRWLDSKFQTALASRPDMQVHVRSVFLQGLLVKPESIWPVWLENRRAIHLELDGMRDDFGRDSRQDLCLSYVRSFPWITSVVMGVHHAAQLKEVLALAEARPFSTDQCARVRDKFEGLPERLLNPSKW